MTRWRGGAQGVSEATEVGVTIAGVEAGAGATTAEVGAEVAAGAEAEATTAETGDEAAVQGRYGVAQEA
jgi:hypothetical protein